MAVVTRTHSYVVKSSHPAYAELDQIAYDVRCLRNSLNYDRRQRLFSGEPAESELTVRKRRIAEKDSLWMAVPSKIAREVSRGLDQDWKSFWALCKRQKALGMRPKPPGYLTGNSRGMFVVASDGLKQGVLKPGWVGITKVTQPLCRLPIRPQSVRMVRVIPVGKDFRVEVVWEKRVRREVRAPELGTIAGIDLGVDNVMTVTCDDAAVKPLIVDGLAMKSINQGAHRLVGKKSSELPGKQRSSRAIRAIWDRRNRQIKHEIHWATRQVVRYCEAHDVSTVVVGWNKGWKSGSTENGNTLGKKGNQKFRSLPLRVMVDTLTYKLAEKGISVIETEESYTSKTSVIDAEQPMKRTDYAGKRVRRGLFRAGNGTLVNADVNGSAQIVRKCKPNAFNWADGVEGKVGLLAPVKVSSGRRLPYERFDEQLASESHERVMIECIIP